MSKKLISISLLFCLIAPLAGTFTWLHVKRQLVKKEVKWKMIAGLDRDELVVLRFTKEETLNLLNWKHSKEFEFNGEMYDIVETVAIEDSVFYYCWWDHEETHLNKKLNSLLAHAAGQNEQSKDRLNKICQFFKGLYFDDLTSQKDQQFTNQLKITFFYTEKYNSLFFPPPVPPPQDVC
ncbi:MAG: hypothetical protein IH598_08260 [Bacteroidales bacterium]|nr:hypothetical protein [Bacteroidales bacterium]